MARILVIDDYEGARRFAKTVLEAFGHTVLEAGDGEEGLRVLREQHAEVVVCDLFMPKRDGLEVIQELRRDFPRLPIIAISAGAPGGQGDALPFARALGADRVLWKPFEAQALLAAVEEHSALATAKE